MSACTFFGHRDASAAIRPKLREAIIYLITHKSVDTFYLGDNGMFDSVSYSVLKELSNEYTYIRYFVVLERLPAKSSASITTSFSDTLFPEGIEAIHPRYAISWRNRWMIERSDFVITYVTHSWGGAAKFAGLAEHQGKTVINIAAK